MFIIRHLSSMTVANTHNTFRRVIVGLKLQELNDIKVANFWDCIVNLFLPGELSARVTCKLEDNVLVLCPEDRICTSREPTGQKVLNRRLSSGSSDLGVVVLQHSPECPILNYNPKEPTTLATAYDTATQEVNVGVAVLVVSSDQHILMTQRPDHMRTFPRAWVPPGGHLEVGESLVECGLRELTEETGLVLDSSNSTTSLLCLWESVHPFFLGFGPPSRHHVVVYLLIKARETWENLHAKIKLDPEEVQACTWMSPDAVKNLCSDWKDKKCIIKYSVKPDTDSLFASELDLTTMFHRGLWQHDKIYSGTQLAITKWLEYYTDTKASSKL